MTKEFILNKEQFLNGSNFDPWFGRKIRDSKLIEENLDQYFVHDRTQDNEDETSINLIFKYTNRKIKNKNNLNINIRLTIINIVISAKRKDILLKSADIIRKENITQMKNLPVKATIKMKCCSFK
ncbi:hypothetical protein H8356DRAFT_1275751 [Neocallimastix lanati (nom. inval.)]|uniref:Uncharacterized protein n=1 Tax=Neocallimastix californiae TaxID=1754190 RepID=A0A1Y2ENI1_9FUNG|nr:hypothetical protein H8356DRAFT_1275751 [Neocallimastix sp. JGI-2020a]ORY73130.1 hypothetical protein LY90DRAFT_503247 [Neocallimastix californiae]|eukprot:ORY73130.1 hypothetical protein LY90DRAFT_503247 [Neocallimastix californiae]